MASLVTQRESLLKERENESMFGFEFEFEFVGVLRRGI